METFFPSVFQQVVLKILLRICIGPCLQIFVPPLAHIPFTNHAVWRNPLLHTQLLRTKLPILHQPPFVGFFQALLSSLQIFLLLFALNFLLPTTRELMAQFFRCLWGRMFGELPQSLGNDRNAENFRHDFADPRERKLWLHSGG